MSLFAIESGIPFVDHKPHPFKQFVFDAALGVTMYFDYEDVVTVSPAAGFPGSWDVIDLDEDTGRRVPFLLAPQTMPVVVHVPPLTPTTRAIYRLFVKGTKLAPTPKVPPKKKAPTKPKVSDDWLKTIPEEHEIDNPWRHSIGPPGGGLMGGPGVSGWLAGRGGVGSSGGTGGTVVAYSPDAGSSTVSTWSPRPDGAGDILGGDSGGDGNPSTGAGNPSTGAGSHSGGTQSAEGYKQTVDSSGSGRRSGTQGQSGPNKRHSPQVRPGTSGKAQRDDDSWDSPDADETPNPVTEAVSLSRDPFIAAQQARALGFAGRTIRTPNGPVLAFSPEGGASATDTTGTINWEMLDPVAPYAGGIYEPSGRPRGGGPSRRTRMPNQAIEALYPEGSAPGADEDDETLAAIAAINTGRPMPAPEAPGDPAAMRFGGNVVAVSTGAAPAVGSPSAGMVVAYSAGVGSPTIEFDGAGRVRRVGR